MRWTVLMSLIASIAANHVIKGMLNLQPNTDIIYIYIVVTDGVLSGLLSGQSVTVEHYST